MSFNDGSAMVEVRILGLPIETWARAQEHVDGLLREFALLVSGVEQGVDHDVPRQLLDLITELQADYAGLGNAQTAQLADAARTGVPTLDLTYQVPPQVATALYRLGEAMDAADRYCFTGQHLLSLATPADALAFRRWYLGEFTAQIAGRPPTAWQDWVAEPVPAPR